MGNFFSDIGHAVTKGVTDVGHFVGQAASNPLVQLGAGVLTGGATIPLIMGAGGGLLKPGGNPGQAIAGGIQGGLAGGAGSKLTGVVRAIPGLGGMVAGAPGGVGGIADASTVLAPSGSSAGGVLDAITKALPQSSSGGIDWGSLLNTAGGFVKDHGVDLGLGALAAQQGLAAAKASGRARELQDKALALAEQNWAGAAPLRTAGTAGLLTPKVMNLSAVYGDPANPFARRRP